MSLQFRSINWSTPNRRQHRRQHHHQDRHITLSDDVQEPGEEYWSDDSDSPAPRTRTYHEPLIYIMVFPNQKAARFAYRHLWHQGNVPSAARNGEDYMLKPCRPSDRVGDVFESITDSDYAKESLEGSLFIEVKWDPEWYGQGSSVTEPDEFFNFNFYTIGEFFNINGNAFMGQTIMVWLE